MRARSDQPPRAYDLWRARLTLTILRRSLGDDRHSSPHATSRTAASGAGATGRRRPRAASVLALARGAIVVRCLLVPLVRGNGEDDVPAGKGQVGV